LFLIPADTSFRFFTLPHHKYNLLCIKADVVAVAKSPHELTSLKVHEMFKRDLRLTYDTGLYSVRHKQNRTVLFSDQAAVHSVAHNLAPDQSALQLSGR
jgi:hypothetical protein